MIEITKKSSQVLIQEAEEKETKPESVFGPYFFKDEVCVLFGDENTGKSILAHDIAIAAAGGTSYWPWKYESYLPTLYVDFEMTQSQYANRYIGASKYLPEYLYRVQIDTLGGNSKQILDTILREVIKTQNQPNAVKLLIIDNITYAMDSIQSSKETKELMRGLKDLKKRFDLTIILIAHCVKRKPGTPILSSDLGGSKNLINFVDSAIAIGTSVLGDEIKYIKHIKSRTVVKEKEVQTIEICTEPYLHFQPEEKVDESVHVLESETSSRSSIKPKMEPVIIAEREAGTTIVKIAEKLGVSKSAVGRYCKLYGI